MGATKEHVPTLTITFLNAVSDEHFFTTLWIARSIIRHVPFVPERNINAHKGPYVCKWTFLTNLVNDWHSELEKNCPSSLFTKTRISRVQLKYASVRRLE